MVRVSEHIIVVNRRVEIFSGDKNTVISINIKKQRVFKLFVKKLDDNIILK